MSGDPRDQVRAALARLENASRAPDSAHQPARQKRMADAIDARIEQLSGEKRRDHRRLRFGVAGAALVASVAAAVWIVVRVGPWHDIGPGVAMLRAQGAVTVSHAGSPVELHPNEALTLRPSDELDTADDAHGSVLLASGALVEVLSKSAVRFEPVVQGAESGEELVLMRGTVDLRVPKLGPHRTLRVRTPDALVTVRGTRFVVSVNDEAGRAVTTVHVSEGSVWVDSGGREIVLHRGLDFSSAEPNAAAPVVPPAPLGTEHSPTAPRVETPVGSAGASAPHRDEPASTLEAENELYRRAATAARGGNDAVAVSELGEFIARYPRSPLREDATIERFRALSRLGRTAEAARAAKQYLASFRGGFASAEAQALVARAKSQGAP